MLEESTKENSSNETIINSKSKSKKWGYIIGFGFWPLVLLIIGGLIFLNRNNAFIHFINPSSDLAIVNFQKYDNEKVLEEVAFQFKLKGNSKEELKIEEGKYFINVLNENNEIIRTIDEYVVEPDTDDSSTFFDLIGETVYTAIDISYLYEGNEDLEGSIIETYTEGITFNVPNDSYTEVISQYEKLPEEIEENNRVTLLVPFPKDFFNDNFDDDAAIGEFIGQYLQNKIDESINDSSTLKHIINKSE